MTYDKLDDLKSYSVASELLLADDSGSPETPKWKDKWEMYFHPKSFVE